MTTSSTRPRVSVVMPTFRRTHIIWESINSLVAQTCKDFELIITDDDAAGGTRDIVEQFQDPRIKYFGNEGRLGMPNNLNGGVLKAQGEFILVCHDHDLYDRTFIERMVHLLERHPTAAFAHAGIVFIDENGKPTGREYVMDYASLTPGKQWLAFMLSRFDCPVCANAMVRRRAYEQYGLYDTDYGFIADVEMWMRLSLHGDVGYISEPLIQIRGRESDHEYSGINWDLTETILCIHRLYHKRAFSGLYGLWQSMRLAGRADVYLLKKYLACIKRQDDFCRETGRDYLRNSGIFLSRLVAMVL